MMVILIAQFSHGNSLITNCGDSTTFGSPFHFILKFEKTNPFGADLSKPCKYKRAQYVFHSGKPSGSEA